MLVVLENYEKPARDSESISSNYETDQNRWLQEVLKDEGFITASPDIVSRFPSWKMIVNEKGELNLAVYDLLFPFSLYYASLFGFVVSWSSSFCMWLKKSFFHFLFTVLLCSSCNFLDYVHTYFYSVLNGMDEMANLNQYVVQEWPFA